MSSKHDDDLLTELTKEAKSHWVPPARSEGHDADELDRKLFDRIDAYEAEQKKVIRPAVDGRFWGGVAVITAIAAGALVFAHSRGDSESSAGLDRVESTGPVLTPTAPPVAVGALPVPEAPRATAPANLSAMTSGGELRVDGKVAVVHEVSLHDGQRVEAHGGEAVFAAPGRVDWLLERGTEISAVRAGTHGGAIFLALSVGAVEAQVVPVVAGEAFGVDVDGVRVAVHGTHLRVARPERGGAHVTVDLSEGVISIGAPPKAGSTVGVLVNAPAHVEFSVNDLQATLQIDHDPTHVRTAVDPVALAQSSASAGATPSLPFTTGTTGGSAINPPAVTPHPPSISATAKPPSATEIVTAAVRKCADETFRRSGTLTISSVLTVDVNADGSARLASFNPPLGPELQSCIAKTVYATSWSEPGAHLIPIELHL